MIRNKWTAWIYLWAITMLFYNIMFNNNCFAESRKIRNLVKNGGFEDGLKYWQLTEQAPHAVKIKKPDAAFGSQSCKIDATRRGFNVVTQEICFDDPGMYEISMKIFKSKGTGQNSGWAEITRSPKRMLGCGYTRLGFGNHEQDVWKTFKQKIQIKGKGEKHYIRLLVGKGTGYVLLDSVSVIKGDPTLSNVEFKISRDEVYVSKEIPMPFSILMRCFAESKDGVSMVIELPQNIELTALYGQPRVYSKKLVGTVRRDGADYDQYVMTFRKTRTFLGLIGIFEIEKRYSFKGYQVVLLCAVQR